MSVKNATLVNVKQTHFTHENRFRLRKRLKSLVYFSIFHYSFKNKFYSCSFPAGNHYGSNGDPRPHISRGQWMLPWLKIDIR